MSDENSKASKRVGRLRSVGDVLTEMGRVYREARRKQLSTVDASRLMMMLREIRQVMETENLEQRIEKLEEQVEQVS